MSKRGSKKAEPEQVRIRHIPLVPHILSQNLFLGPRKVLPPVSLGMVLLGGLLLIGFPQPLLGLTTDLTNDPSKMVEKYVSLDQRGARLESISYEVLKPYIAWAEEPAWGQVVVISDFSVSHDSQEWNVISNVEAVIPVTFRVVGVMHWGTATFFSEPRTEQVDVRIKAVDNRWRIVSPPFPPHVGRQRLIDFVRHASLQETDEERKQQLKRLRESLEGTK